MDCPHAREIGPLLINLLLNPGEPAFSESAVARPIEIGYSPKRLILSGRHIRCLVALFSFGVFWLRFQKSLECGDPKKLRTELICLNPIFKREY